jgi:anamorsin
MSPITIDTSDDFVSPFAKPAQSVSSTRSLLLAPPSIASREDRLRDALAAHDRSVTDVQMLDRLSAGLVSLPAATYDLILVLTDADATRSESTLLLNRDVFAKIVPALKAGGRVQAQDGSLGSNSAGPDAREAILAGLVAAPDGFTKADDEEEAVPLKLSFGKAKKRSTAGPAVSSVTIHQANGADAKLDMAPPVGGVGFIDFSNGNSKGDDEFIDEDDLLDDDDLQPIIRKCPFTPGPSPRTVY